MEQTVQRIEVFIKNAAKTDKNKRQRVLFHLLSDFLQQIVVEAEADNKSKIQELQGRSMAMLWQLIQSDTVKNFVIALQDVIPRCFTTLFAFGGPRELSKTVKTMQTTCDNKKADKATRLVVIKCLGEITAAHAMLVHPLLSDTITVLIRQLKATEGFVREAALCSLSQVVEGSGRFVVGSTNPTQLQQTIVKALGKAAQDKSADLRTRVAACLVTLAIQIRQVAGTTSKPDSPIAGLSPLFLLCQKHIVDRSHGVKSAFARALGLLCATVAQIAADRKKSDPRMPPKASKNASAKAVFKQFKSKDREVDSIVNFKMCAEFLATKVNKAPSAWARSSALHAWCIFLQSCARCLAKVDLSVLVDTLLGVLDDAKAGDRAQLAASAILRRGFGRAASEEQQIGLLHVLMRCLSKPKAGGTASSGRSRSSSDAGVGEHTPGVLAFILREISWLLRTTRSAAQGTVERLPKLLLPYLPHYSVAVRHAVAQCIAASYTSLGHKIAHSITEQMVEGLLVSHAELSALLATQQITPVQHQRHGAAVMGHATALLALMRACEGAGDGIGCKRRLRADELACVFGVAENLVGFQDDPNPNLRKKSQLLTASVLRVSCIHAGWLLVVGLINTSGWVQSRLPPLINLWDAAFDPISRQMPQRFHEVVQIAQCLVPALGALVTLCRLFPGAIHARSKSRAPSEHGVLCSSMSQYLGCAMSLINTAQKLMPSSGASEKDENVLLWFRTLVLEAYYMLSPKVFKPYQKELLILAINTFVDDPDICTKTSLARQLLHAEDFPLEMTLSGVSSGYVAENVLDLPPNGRKEHESLGVHMFDAYVESNTFADLLHMPVPPAYGMDVTAVVPPPTFAFGFTTNSNASTDDQSVPEPPIPYSYKDIHVEIRAVDAALVLFAKLFAKGTSDQTKEKLVSHFHTAVKERRSKQKSLLRECVEYNACVAMLAAVRWYSSRMGKQKDASETSKSKATAKQSSGVPPWWDKCRKFILGFLQNSEAPVRRVAGEAIGWLTRMGVVVLPGEPSKRTAVRKEWTTVVVKHLEKMTQKKAGPTQIDGQTDPQKLAFQTRAGALFAMACVCRMFNLISKDVSVRKQALRILKPSVSIIYGAARETRQPVRTWMLHTWYTWIHCELSVAADPKSVLTKYHEPTVALIHAHILCDTATGCRGNSIRSGLGVCLARLVELLFCCLGPSLPAHIPPAGSMNKFTSSLRKTMKIWHLLWSRSLDDSYQLASQSCAKAAASLAKVSASQIHQWPELRAMSKALLWQLRLSGKTPLDAVSADMLQKSVADTAAVLVGSTVPFAFLPRPSSATLQYCLEFTWHCREQTFMSQHLPDKEKDNSLSRYLRSLISSFEITAGAGTGDNITTIMGQRVQDLVCALIHNPGCAAEHIHTRVAEMWEFLKAVAGSQGTNNKGTQHKLRMQRDEDDDEEDEREQEIQVKQAPEVVGDMLGGVRLRWQTKELAAELLRQVLRESALIASRPGADSGMRAHFDLALARKSEGKHFLVLKLEEMLNIALALRGTQIGNQSLPPLEVAAIHLFDEMMNVFGPVPDPDVAVDDPVEGEQPSRAPSLMQQHDAYLSGMLRPAFQQLDADPAYMLAAFDLVANAVLHGATMSVGKNVRSLAPKNPMGRRVVVTDAIDADASQGVLLVRALDGSNNYRTKTTLAVTDYPGSNLRFASGEGSDDDDDDDDNEEGNILKKPIPQTGAYGHTHTVLLLAQLRVLAQIWLNQSGQSKPNLHLYSSNLGTVHRLSFAAVCDSIVLRQKVKKSDKRLSLHLSRYEDVDQVREYYEQSWALAIYGAAITLPHVTDAEAKSSFPLLFWLILRTISGGKVNDSDAQVCLEALRLLAGETGSDGSSERGLSVDDTQRAVHALSLCVSERVGKKNDTDEEKTSSVDTYAMLHSIALTLRCLTLQEHTGQLSCPLLACASRVLTTALRNTSSDADLNRVASVCLECACLVAKVCSVQVSSSGPEDQHAFASAASLLLQLLQNPRVAKIGKPVQDKMSILLDHLLVWVATLSGNEPDGQSAKSSSNAVCALIDVMLQCAEVASQPEEPTPGQVSVCQWLLQGLHKVVTTVPEYITQKLHFQTQNFAVKCMRASNVTIVSMAVQHVASFVRTAHQYAADKTQSQRFSATCNYVANFMSEVAALFFTPHNGDSKRIALRVATLQLMCSLLQSRSTVLGEEGKAALLRLVLQLAVGVSARLGKSDEALSTSIGNALLGLATSARNIFKQQVAALAPGPRGRLQGILQQAVVSSKRRQATSQQSVKLSIS